MSRLRRFLRLFVWVVAYGLGLLAIFLTQTWVWWQAEPRSPGTAANALWARHQWVGEPHTGADYRALGDLLRQNKITDVFFHAGPFEPDGTVPAAKYTNARKLIEAMRRHAPGVRAQAYLGQILKVDGHGILDLNDAAVRARILETDKVFLDLGFDGIHYDVEPVYPDDKAFLDLLGRTRELTKARGRVVSVSLEQLTLADFTQPIYKALIPQSGGQRYPARLTEDFLGKVADRADQIAIMTYDVGLPTKSLAGKHFAWHTERTLRLVGDRTTVFMGVPTYRPPSMGWAEDLPGALRGIRRGLDALDRPPARPYGVAVYAEWTTNPQEWARYRATWLST